MRTRRSILEAAGTVGLWTLASRVSGLLRDVLSTKRFGAGEAWDAFVVAWTVPNTFRRLFTEGALATAFIPTLAEVREREGKEEAARLVNAVFSALLLGLTAVACLGAAGLFLFPEASLRGVANVEKLDLIVRLLEVMLPYLVLVFLTAFLGAVLNTLHHFTAPSAAPLLLNLFWIVALLFLVPALGPDPSRQVFGIAAAVVVGGVAQVAICIPPLRRHGVRIRPTLKLHHPAFGRMFRLLLTVVIGLAPTQVNLLTDRFIAEALVPGDGANSYLYYGTRIVEFPLALVGIALATAVFPTFSLLAVRGERTRLREIFGGASAIACFVSIPAAVGLILLAFPIVRFLFEHGEFGRTDTLATARVIRAYTLGIPAVSAVQIATRLFFAQGDLRTPVRIAAATVAANLALDLALVGPFGESGVALATSIAAFLNLTMLGLALRAKSGPAERPARLVPRVCRVAALAGAMGGVCYMMYRLLDPGDGGDGSLLRSGVAALLPVAAGIAFYFAGAAALRFPELREIREALHRSDAS